MDQNKIKEIVALIESGNPDAAREKLQNAGAAADKDAEVNYYLGMIAFQKDEYDEAIEYISKAIEIKPDDSRFHELLGQAYGLKAQRSGMVKGSLLMPKIKKSFLRALELNPDSLLAREGLFMFYLFVPGVAGGDEKQALKIAAEIQEIKQARGHLANAIYKTKQNQVEEATELFEKAVRAGGDDAEVQMRAGQFFLSQKHPKAIEAFDAYIRLKPSDPAGYNSKGKYYQMTKEYDKAIAMFDQALEKNNNHLLSRFNRAEVYTLQDKKDAARADYQFIIDRDKNPLTAKAKEALRAL